MTKPVELSPTGTDTSPVAGRRPPLSIALFTATLVPYLVVAGLAAGSVEVIVGAAGGVLVDGDLTFAETAPSLASLALGGLVGLLAPLLVLPFTFLAGAAVSASQAYGGRPSVRAAWWWAAGRHGAVLRVTGVMLAAGLGIVVALLPVVLVLTAVGLPAWLAYLAAGALLVACCAPCARALRGVVIDEVLPSRGTTVPLRPGLGQSRSEDERAQRTMAVGAAFLVASTVLFSHAPEEVVPVLSLARHAVTLALGVAVVRDVVGDAVTGPWGRPVAGRSTLRSSSGRAGTVRQVLALVVALVMAFGAEPVVRWVGFGTDARVQTVTVPEWNGARDLVVVDDTVVAVPASSAELQSLLGCTPSGCTTHSWDLGTFPAAVTAQGDQVWSAQWEADLSVARAPGKDPLRLVLTSPAGSQDVDTFSVDVGDLDDVDGVRLRDSDALPLLAAAEGHVATASVLRHPGDGSVLRLGLCDEAGCDVVQTAMDWAPEWNRASPTIAVGVDGTTYVAAGGTRWEGREGEGVTLYVREPGGSVHERALVDPPTRPTTQEEIRRAKDAEADVRVGPDGVVWVLYRVPHEDQAALVRCDEPTCGTWSHVRVPSVSAARGALAVDASGRPMVVAIEPEGVVVLRSCRDDWCGETDESVVTRWSEGDAGSDLLATITLDADRPVVAVSSRRSRGPALLTWCAEARCGAA